MFSQGPLAPHATKPPLLARFLSKPYGFPHLPCRIAPWPVVQGFREGDCKGTDIPEADIAPSTSSLGEEVLLFAFKGGAVPSV